MLKGIPLLSAISSIQNFAGMTRKKARILRYDHKFI